jgi:hypothetical protein
MRSTAIGNATLFKGLLLNDESLATRLYAAGKYRVLTAMYSLYSRGPARRKGLAPNRHDFVIKRYIATWVLAVE